MDQLPIILICGGSCSGKTVFAGFFSNSYVVNMDNFFFGERVTPDNFPSNYDHPNPVHIQGCADVALALAQKQPATVIKYDHKTKTQDGNQTLTILPDTKYIIVEGIFAFQEPLLHLGNLKIFLDTPREIRVARRMIRDEIKGRSDIETMAWSINVEKAHDIYIEPLKKFADIVIPFSYNPIVFDRKLAKPDLPNTE